MRKEKSRIWNRLIWMLVLVFCMGINSEAASVLATGYDHDYGYDEPGYGISAVLVNENRQSLLLLPGESYQITFNDPAQVAAVSYTTGDPVVASVSENGNITMLTQGQTTMYVTGTDISGYTFSAEIYVFSPLVSPGEIFVNAYGAAQSDGFYNLSDEISLSYIPASAAVSVVSDNENLSVVYSSTYWGNYVSLKAKQEGNYTVTIIIIINDRVFTVPVTVRMLYFDRHEKTACDLDSGSDDEFTLTWIQGSSMLALYKGETATLHVNGVLPDEKIQFTSSNKSVASVNSKGKVTAKGYGAAKITASVGAFTLTYEVGVSYKTAIKALRYDIEHYNSIYSQPKRMADGYYDCSSFVWRGYKAAGKYLNKNGGWAPTAADLAKWCVDNRYMLYEGAVSVSKLLPGDLIFEMDESEANGRYKGIYHVDMYQGNATLITVARQKYRSDTLYNVMVARPCVPTPAITAKKSGKSIKLTWKDIYGVTGYKIYRCDSKNGKYKCIGTVKNAKEYKDATAKKGKTYYYKMRAYWKADGNTYYGKYSAVIKKQR